MSRRDAAFDVRLAEVRRIARGRLGIIARTSPGDLRLLAHTLEPGEQVKAIALGFPEKARQFGLTITGTDRRLLLTQRRATPFGKDRVHTYAWADVGTIGFDGPSGVIMAGGQEWRFHDVMPQSIISELAGLLSGARLQDSLGSEPENTAVEDHSEAKVADRPGIARALPAGMHRTEIDGVPVYWVSGDGGRLTAELVFGVGIQDESFISTGITHLVEHLTMRRLGETSYECNASVGPHMTAFQVRSGQSETVVEHLLRVCRSVAGLDATGLDIERRVLAVEEEQIGGDWITLLPLSLWLATSDWPWWETTAWQDISRRTLKSFIGRAVGSIGRMRFCC